MNFMKRGIRAESAVASRRAHHRVAQRIVSFAVLALVALAGASTAHAQVYNGTPPNGTPITLSASAPGGSAMTTLVVRNDDASATLTINPAPLPSGWISTDLNKLQNLSPGETRTYAIFCNPMAVGTQNATLTVGTNDPTQSTVAHPISCTGVAAGPQCPIIKLAGDGQALLPNDTSLPLRVKAAYVTSSVPPSGELFTWTITSGNAVFAANGAATITQSALYEAQGMELYDAFSQQAIIAGSAIGNVTIQVNSGLCAASPPATFSAEISALVLPTIEKIAGDGASGNTGEEVEIRGRLPSMALVDRAAAGNAVTMTISGPATFDANGGTTLSVIPDLSGFFSAIVVYGQSSGTVNVTATAPGYEPATWTLSNLGGTTPPPPPPPQYVVTVVSGDGQIGLPGTRGQDLVLRATRTDGTPLAGERVTWTRPFGFSAQLDGTTSTTDADGRARMGFTFTSQSGASIIDGRLDNGQSARFTVTAGTGGLDLISGDNQAGIAGTRAAEPLVFQLTSTSGAPVVAAPIDFTVIAGSATLDATQLVTDSQGRVLLGFRYGTSPGAIRIQAAAGGQEFAFASATSVAGAVTALSGNGQSATVGAALALPLSVQLSTTTPGANLAGITVTWEVLSGGGQLGTTTSVTDSAGVATTTYTVGTAPGVNQVRATIPGGANVVFTATATAQGGTAVTFEIASGNNQTVPTNTPSAPLVVRLRDAAGNPLPNRTVAWRVTPVGNGSVDPATSTTNANGEASTIATIGLPGAANVTATLQNATGAGSNVLSFTINGGVQNLPDLTDNQESVGAAIDNACPQLAVATNLTPGQQDLLQRCSELVVGAGTNPGDVREALNQMLADEAGAQADAAISTTAAQFDNLKARIAALRSGTRGSSFGGLAIASSTGVLPLSFLPSNIVQSDEADTSGEAGAGFSRWGFFATGTIGQGDRDRTDNNPGFDFDTYGLTAGVDYRYSDSLVLGAALGYNNNDTDIGGDQGRLETSGYSISGYATYFKDDSFYTDAVLTFGRNSYDVSRRIRYTIDNLGGGTSSIDQTATASPDGDQVALALSLGRDFARGAWNFGPYVRGTYTKIDFDPYIEKMSDPNGPGAGLAMAVEGRDLKSLEGVLGGKASYTISTSWGVLMPNVQLEWLHEFEDDPENIVTRFVNDPSGTDILVAGDEVDSNYFNVGLGLSGVFANGRSAFVYYEHRAGQTDFTQDSLAIGVRIEF